MTSRAGRRSADKLGSSEEQWWRRATEEKRGTRTQRRESLGITVQDWARLGGDGARTCVMRMRGTGACSKRTTCCARALPWEAWVDSTYALDDSFRDRVVAQLWQFTLQSCLAKYLLTHYSLWQNDRQHCSLRYTTDMVRYPASGSPR